MRQKFNPQPGDVIVTANAGDYVCLSKEDAEKYKSHYPIVGEQHRLGWKTYQDWENDGNVAGDFDECISKEFKIVKIIPKNDPELPLKEIDTIKSYQTIICGYPVTLLSINGRLDGYPYVWTQHNGVLFETDKFGRRMISDKLMQYVIEAKSPWAAVEVDTLVQYKTDGVSYTTAYFKEYDEQADKIVMFAGGRTSKTDDGYIACCSSKYVKLAD